MSEPVAGEFKGMDQGRLSIGQAVTFMSGGLAGLTGVVAGFRPDRRCVVQLETIQGGVRVVIAARALSACPLVANAKHECEERAVPPPKHADPDRSGAQLPSSDLGGLAVLPIQFGDRVRIQYFRVRAVPGKRRVRRAVEFVAGTSNMIPTLSWGVVGMVAGQRKQFTLQPGEAFGRSQPGLVKEIPRYRFPKQLKPQVGQRLTAVQRRSGHRRRVTVVEVTPYSVIVDGNHSLAGKAVVVEILVVGVNPRPSRHPEQPQPDLGDDV